jgi:hypothetical protein
MINRRDMLKGTAVGLVTLLGSHLLPNVVQAADKATGTAKVIPKRVIFFFQNQGFDPLTCIPKGLKESCALKGVTLAEPMKALEPYKDRMHIITGLHGRHTTPSHSAYFGALGGYRGGIGVPPAAPTIDYVMSQALPQTILPQLCIGMDSIENMQTRPTIATLTASGAARPIFMHSDPNNLYQMIFGSIATGDINKQYHARSKVFTQVEKIAGLKGKELPAAENERYAGYVDGFHEMNALNEKLSGVSAQLKKYAPKFDDRYTKPRFEIDWHDALVEIGLAALQANITNVLTFGSGRGEIFGSYKGLGIIPAGHNLGHMEQPDNEIWVKIRQYNCAKLVQLIKGLEATPEGSGTMMDHTLIVYGSNNGNKQHTDGSNWPFVLIGNSGGPFKMGQYTHVIDRPLNDLYTTFLHGIGKPVDSFNMDKNLAKITKSKLGPLAELMA